MKILRILCSALLPLLLWQAARAQPQLEDVVYLKNGSIIRGSLKSAATENPLRIELLGGSLLCFSKVK
ncbi:MAG: hypothetical protein IPN22_10570 [Bacteroidetes bacterium]|nr:hypothetical protein [Bacteroidota bacterium]